MRHRLPRYSLIERKYVSLEVQSFSIHGVRSTVHLLQCMYYLSGLGSPNITLSMFNALVC
ncbi:hypothetical protein BDV39DRAFT_179134 [Aspergillus sergii]|uniref:Uncharacterized protein n=1 Tax=Aspergillus sergii TaxID=1034303 RepID=A0A5N6WWD2_9EURO|nr:hypothetical protein BDV39DRAFT_179134 [Aspergillus sergii]